MIGGFIQAQQVNICFSNVKQKLEQALIKMTRKTSQDHCKKHQDLQKGKEIELSTKNSKGSQEFIANGQGEGEGDIGWKVT